MFHEIISVTLLTYFYFSFSFSISQMHFLLVHINDSFTPLTIYLHNAYPSLIYLENVSSTFILKSIRVECNKYRSNKIFVVKFPLLIITYYCNYLIRKLRKQNKFDCEEDKCTKQGLLKNKYKIYMEIIVNW